MLAGSLEIEILTSMSRMKADLKEVSRTVGGAMSSVEKSVAQANSALQALGVTVGAGYFLHLIKGAIDAADHLNDLSKSTGIAVGELAGLKLLARQSGTDLDGLAKGINKMSVEMGKAPDKFKALGITATDSKGALMQFADIFDLLPDINQRNALAQAVFSKSWAELAPVLSEGSKKIGETIEKGERLSAINKQLTKDSDEFNDKWAELVGTGGLLNRQIAPLLPILIALADGMLDAKDRTEGLADGFNPLSEAFRAAAILGGNVAFVIKAIATEAVGMATQLIALGHLDFKSFSGIGSEMTENAKKARAAFDEWEKSILNAGKAATAVAAKMSAEEKLAADKAAAARAAAAKDAAARAAAFLETKKESDAAYQRELDAQIEALKRTEAVKAEISSRAIADVASQRRMAVINEQEAIEQTAMLEITALGNKRSALLDELEISKKKEKSEKEQAALLGQVALIEAQMQSRGLDYGRAIVELQDRRLKLAQAVRLAEIADDEAAQNAAATDAGVKYNAATEAVNAYAKEIKDANGEIALEVSLLGKTEIARDTAIAQYRVMLDFERRSLEIKKLGLSAADQEAKLAALEAVKAQAMSAASDRVMLDNWQKSVDQYNDVFRKGFADMVNGGQGAWKSFTKSLITTFKTTVADQIYKAFLQPFVVRIVAQMVGVTNGIGGGSSLSGGASLLNGGMSLGNTLGTAYANMTGTGIDGLLATNAAFGTAEAAGASMLSTLSAAAPYIAAAIAVAGMLESPRGGPKSEGGSDVAATIQSQYDTIAKALGITSATRFGAFTSTDPQGDALTQLQVSAFSNDQNVYSRQNRLGGFENVGRSQEELTAAIGEETTRAIFAALKASDLESKYRQYLNGVGDSASEQAAAIARLTTARALEDKLLELSSTDAENLARTRQKELEATDPMLRSLLEQIYAQEDLKKAMDETAQASEKMVDILGGAFDTLAAAIDVEREALAKQIATANTSISKLEGLASSLNSALSGFNTGSTIGMSQGAARAQILAAIAIARAGGPLPDAESLRDALTVIGNTNADGYKTFADMARDTAKNAQAARDLNSLTGIQLSAERQALSELQRQGGVLDQTLAAARAQVEAIQGNSTVVMSLAAALANFQGAVRTTVSTSSTPIVTPSGVTADDVRSFVAGMPPTLESEMKIYEAARANGVSSGFLEASLGWAPGTVAQWVKENNLTPFASGVNSVPRDMPAMLHKGEEVRPAAYVRQDRESIAALVDEVAMLRQELASFHSDNSAENRGILVQAASTNSTLDKVTEGGNAMLVATPTGEPLEVTP